MAHIVTENVTVAVSKLYKDGDANVTSQVTAEMINHIVDEVQKLVAPGVVVEVVSGQQHQ
jgi:hypothetical protein